MKIILNIISALLSYLLSIISFFLFLGVFISSVLGYIFGPFIPAYISYKILYSFHKRIKYLVDPDYEIYTGMCIDIFIFFANLILICTLGLDIIAYIPILNTETSIYLVLISMVLMILSLYGLGIILMTKEHNKKSKNSSLQLDDDENI